MSFFPRTNSPTRRHLNESQRRMAAAKLADLPRGGNHGNRRTGDAAKALGLGTMTVSRASRVRKRRS
jgi:hypothetical protein